MQSMLAIESLYFTTNTMIKISLLILYYRLFNHIRLFCWTLYGMSAIVMMWFFGCTLAIIFGCVPFSFHWNQMQPGHCINLPAFVYGSGISNMFLDFMVLCLPFPMIFTLHTNTRVRLSLAAIFTLGFL